MSKREQSSNIIYISGRFLDRVDDITDAFKHHDIVELRAKDIFIELAIQLAEHFIKKGTNMPMQDGLLMSSSGVASRPIKMAKPFRKSLLNSTMSPLIPQAQPRKRLLSAKNIDKENVIIMRTTANMRKGLRDAEKVQDLITTTATDLMRV